MHGSQSIYPVSSVASEYEKRDKKHRKRRVEEEQEDRFDGAVELGDEQPHVALGEKGQDFDYDRDGRQHYFNLFDLERPFSSGNDLRDEDVDDFDDRDWEKISRLVADDVDAL